MNIDLAAMIRRAGVYRQPAFTAPAIEPTGAQEKALLRIYMAVVRGWQTQWFDRIRPAYAATIGEGLRDSVNDVEGAVGTAGDAINRLVVALGADLGGWAVDVEQWHRGRFGQLFTPAGVRLDMVLGPGDVGPTLQAVLADNLSLIRSLNDQMRNGISGAVFRGLSNRTPARDVAREIQRLAGVGKSRAELIAADQLQKLTGRLDQARQEQLGIVSFEWAHSGKKHPRQHHLARNGLVYRWDSPVGKTDPPGFAIRCGCRSRAVVDLEADEGAGTAPASPPPPPPPAARTTRPRRRPVARDPEPSRPDSATLAREARDYVLANGRREGVEFLSAYDEATGKTYGTNRGGVDFCELTSEMVAACANPERRMVLHHNHPSSSSLSQPDIEFLNRPGVKGIAAHGHNGSYYYAEAGELPLGRVAYQAVQGAVHEKMQALITSGVFPVEATRALHNHAVWTALHAHGRIRYTAALEGETAEYARKYATFFDLIVRGLTTP